MLRISKFAVQCVVMWDKRSHTVYGEKGMALVDLTHGLRMELLKCSSLVLGALTEKKSGCLLPPDSNGVLDRATASGRPFSIPEGPRIQVIGL